MSDPSILSPVSPNILPSIVNLCSDEAATDDFSPEIVQAGMDKANADVNTGGYQ